jgi:hypothetical protein
MADLAYTVKAADAMKRATMNVTVTGMRVLRIRLWLGVKLIGLACWVMGCGCEVELEAK